MNKETDTEYCLYCDQNKTQKEFSKRDWDRMKRQKDDVHYSPGRCKRCTRLNIRLVSSPNSDTLIFEIGR